MSESLQKGSSKRFRPRVPLDQRKRVVKACTSCRLRKRRCILGTLDICRNCRKSNLSCIFETEEDIPAPSTSRMDHDDVIARFNKSYPEIGLTADHSSFLLEIFMVSGQKSREEGFSKEGCAFCHTPRHPSPHETAPIFAQTHPKAEARTPSMERTSPEFAIALTDNITGGDDMLAHKDFLACATAAVSRSERPDFTEDTTSFYPTDESYYGNEDVLIEQILEDFPSRAGAEVLISLFFLYAEANWYYFDETSFRDQLFGLYDSGLSPTFTSPKFICLTLTVFALGSQFVHLYQGDHLNHSQIMTAVHTGIPGTSYFQHAQKLVPQIIACPSLEGLLSCLILALYVLPIHNTNTCYTYLGLALRIAICHGLHRKSADPAISPSLLEVRNRIFWTTYSIERRVTLSLGYPETLQSKDIDCPLPQRRPDLDSPISFRAERLLAYTKLTLLLNRVISLRTFDKCSTENIRSHLLSWKANLPAQLTILNDASLRLNVHLQLDYCMIWIYIGRAALIDRVRSLLGKHEPERSDYDTRGEGHELSETCVKHAAQIIDLIDLLRSRKQLGRFSQTDFHTCSSAAIIVLLDSILRPRLESYSKVSSAMDALRYMTSGSDFAKNNLKYVSNFQVAVNKALASMYRRDHEQPCPMRNFDSLGRGESPTSGGAFMRSSMEPFHAPDSIPPESPQEASTEDVDLSYHQHDSLRPNMALFDDIETALEDCSFTQLHLLGFDSLYSSHALN